MNSTEWEEKRRAALEGIEEVMGPLPTEQPGVPAVTLLEELRLTGYIRRRVWYEAESSDHVPATNSFARAGLPHALAKLRLIDRFRLMIFPLILGKIGKEPIYADYPRLPLELVGTKVLDSRLVLLEYRPAARAS